MRLHEGNPFKIAPLTNHLRRNAELIAKSAGECLMRAVTGFERDRENIGSAIRQLASCIA
ncbi:hypothetical protein D3C86_2098010 [compost metagenome]